MRRRSASKPRVDSQSYGSISTAYATAYFHGKVGYKTDTLKYGAELTAFDDKGSQATYRHGAFLGDIPLGPVTMGISAGYQVENTPAKDDGFYSLLEFSVPLALRN